MPLIRYVLSEYVEHAMAQALYDKMELPVKIKKFWRLVEACSVLVEGAKSTQQGYCADGCAVQTVPNELCMDSLCTVKRYEIPILSVVFSVTVQNILQ